MYNECHFFVNKFEMPRTDCANLFVPPLFAVCGGLLGQVGGMHRFARHQRAKQDAHVKERFAHDMMLVCF